MLEHLRKFIKYLFKSAERTFPSTAFAARLGLLKSLRITQRYLANISKPGLPAATREPRSASPIGLPKRIWFLSDVQWEKQELIPELGKIAQVHVSDLGVVAQAGVCRDEVLKLVAAEAKDLAPDLIVLYAREGMLSHELFGLLRGKNAPIWGLNLDDKTEFYPEEGLSHGGRYGYSRWAPSFDLNLCSSRIMVDEYRRLNAKAFYFPEGYHLRPEYIEKPLPATYPLSFVGAIREDRQDLIRSIESYGFTPKLFGRGWLGGEMAPDPWRVYRASQINLGIGFASPSRVTALKARDFECPGAQACYLTTYNWELAEHFEIGKEILCYRSPEELVEMLVYYLKRPEECARIALAGFRRAQAHHTWEQRFLSAFQAEFR